MKFEQIVGLVLTVVLLFLMWSGIGSVVKPIIDFFFTVATSIFMAIWNLFFGNMTGENWWNIMIFIMCVVFLFGGLFCVATGRY